jgi:prepilin-type N-terminal cleavage/methylation domain-containing protein
MRTSATGPTSPKVERVAGWARCGAERRRGFTLIEILAVVAILALMSVFVLPNLGAVRFRSLNDEARRIAAQLELGRQRAVVMGVPHRLLFDLDAQAYRLEWLTTEAEARGEHVLWEPPEYDVRGETPLPLAAPREEERLFRPLPGQFGTFRYIDDQMVLAVHESGGWIEQGEVAVTFERDGTASYTEISIEDETGRTVVLDVMPLADAVRVRDETT